MVIQKVLSHPPYCRIPKAGSVGPERTDISTQLTEFTKSLRMWDNYDEATMDVVVRHIKKLVAHIQWHVLLSKRCIQVPNSRITSLKRNNKERSASPDTFTVKLVEEIEFPTKSDVDNVFNKPWLIKIPTELRGSC